MYKISSTTLSNPTHKPTNQDIPSLTTETRATNIPRCTTRRLILADNWQQSGESWWGCRCCRAAEYFELTKNHVDSAPDLAVTYSHTTSLTLCNNNNTGSPLSRQWEIPRVPDDSRHSSVGLGMLSVTHIMSVLVLLSVVGVGMQQCMIHSHTFNTEQTPTKLLYRCTHAVYNKQF